MSSQAKVPFKEHEVADYERRRYRGIDQRIVHGRETQILRKMLGTAGAGFPAGKGALAIDAPCGYGRFTGLLLEAGFRPVNCDLSLAMVRRARAKDDTSPNPVGIVGNITRGLPFRDGSFPLVFSLRFFHHLHTPEERRAAFGEFARAGSGWLILSFYRANFLHKAQRALRRRVKRTKTRIKMISRREFLDEAARAGFRVVRISPLFRGVHAHHIALLKKSE
jgi:SAM-dependent methyltransferase